MKMLLFVFLSCIAIGAQAEEDFENVFNKIIHDIKNQPETYHQCVEFGQNCSLLDGEFKAKAVESIREDVQAQIVLMNLSLSLQGDFASTMTRVRNNYPNLKLACARLYVISDTDTACNAIYEKTSAAFAKELTL